MTDFTNKPAITFSPALGGPNDKDVAVAHEVIKAREEAINEQKRNTLFLCGNCETLTPVRVLTHIQQYNYIAPYGCASGDYYRETVGDFICPKCGTRNRGDFSPDIDRLKQFFGARIDRRTL